MCTIAGVCSLIVMQKHNYNVPENPNSIGIWNDLVIFLLLENIPRKGERLSVPLDAFELMTHIIQGYDPGTVDHESVIRLCQCKL